MAALKYAILLFSCLLPGLIGLEHLSPQFSQPETTYELVKRRGPASKALTKENELRRQTAQAFYQAMTKRIAQLEKTIDENRHLPSAQWQEGVEALEKLKDLKKEFEDNTQEWQ